ncbi:hypothetical protein SAMN05443253_107101 [Bacillus sp. OK048]|nr:hypothetical protein SAMN05443253_107101 [Bacillus sp. OK048]
MNYDGYPNYYGMSPIQEPSQQPRFGGEQQHGSQHPPFGGGQQHGSQHPPFGGGQQHGSQHPPMGGGQHHDGAPSTPPPSHTPQESVSAFAVDPGAIRGCLHRFTFVWLNNGRSFWFYPTFVGRDSVAGYRWRGFRWVYYGTDLRRIRSFRCT